MGGDEIPIVKYGLIDYSHGYGHLAAHQPGEAHYVNIGDDIQSLAILHLYQRFGVSEQQMVWIRHDELGTYRGDYVLLPMNMFGTKGDIFPLSPNIIPVFVGFNYVSSRVLDYADFFHQYAPIGCRDEYTLRVMRDAGIEAYLTGCLSIALPRREAVKASKVFMVDVPDSLIEHVPESVLFCAEHLTHEVEVDSAELISYGAGATTKLASTMLQRYAEEAALVVTSRLHCAAPCLAMGIPVIIVKDNIDTNLSWIDRFSKIYTCQEYECIDWQPKSIDIEWFKDHVFNMFSSRIEAVLSTRSALLEVSSFYEARAKSEYNNILAQQLVEQMSGRGGQSLRYAIWGVGAGGALARLLIQEKFPDFYLVAAFDSFEKGRFFGVEIAHPDFLESVDFDFLFICTHAGRHDALKKVSLLGLQAGKDYMFMVSRVVASSHGFASAHFKKSLQQLGDYQE